MLCALTASASAIEIKKADQAAEPTCTAVFVSGESGCHLIRTPQILATRWDGIPSYALHYRNSQD